jgi:cytochrome c biogenesis protein CcmG, thiol:disulfide interchange protein DsbE
MLPAMRALLLSLLIAAPMPVRRIEDAPHLVAEAAGKPARPVVMHFWATWCSACRDEFPALGPELLALPGRGVAVTLVSIDRPDDREKAEKMLVQYKLASLPALLLDAPGPDPVAKAMSRPDWDGTLPATFVFDAAGKLQKSFLGRAEPAAVEAAVRALMR